MSKVRVFDVNPNERYALVGEVLDSVTQLRNKNDVIDFLIGLLTPSEMLMVARRVHIARRILEGKTYIEICEEMGVGNGTIRGVEKWMRRGDKKRQDCITRCVLRKTQKEKVQKSFSENPLDRYAHHRMAKELPKQFFG
jgi:uncharacterized protein YerC